MLYARGNRKDYDKWADLTGDPSWSYENLLPFFKKSEGYIGTKSRERKLSGMIDFERFGIYYPVSKFKRT
jgi:choline dehydrogenase